MLRFSKSLKHYVTDLSCVKRKQSMERLKKKGRFASMKQIKRSETLRQSQKKKTLGEQTTWRVNFIFSFGAALDPYNCKTITKLKKLPT